jgi:carboxyl-terminal processing protease
MAVERGRLAALFLAASTALAGCAALPTRDLSSSHEVALAFDHREVAPPSTTGFAPANATPERRRDTLDRIWRVIDDEYFDPTFATVDLPALKARSREDLAKVASDADFYRVLQTAIGGLPDSHTGVLTPREAELERTQQTTLIGIGYRVVEGHLVIVEVLPGFPAHESGVRVGMLMESVDGQSLDAAFLAKAAKDAVLDPSVDPAISREAAQLRAVSALLAPGEGTPRAHHVALRRADDSVWQTTLRARDGDVPTEEGLTLRPSGVAVLRLSRFDPSVVPALVRDVQKAGTESRALIVDLRNNLGGDVGVFSDLIDQFLDGPVVVGSETLRFWHFPVTFDVHAEPAAHPYLKPVAVLIDGATASAAEMTAHALVELREAIPVGESTCGCVVGLAREFVLPDGGVLRVAEVGFRSPHGRRMERDPLEPAITVAPTLAQLRAGADVAVDEAERALLGKLPAPGQ